MNEDVVEIVDGYGRRSGWKEIIFIMIIINIYI